VVSARATATVQPFAASRMRKNRRSDFVPRGSIERLVGLHDGVRSRQGCLRYAGVLEACRRMVRRAGVRCILQPRGTDEATASRGKGNRLEAQGKNDGMAGLDHTRTPDGATHRHGVEVVAYNDRIKTMGRPRFVLSLLGLSDFLVLRTCGFTVGYKPVAASTAWRNACTSTGERT